MKVKKKGRFIYFYDVSSYEKKKLERLLYREARLRDNNKLIRSVNMLFYDDKENAYYTYFGYAEYLRKHFPYVFFELDKIKGEIFIDVEKIRKLGKYELRDYQVDTVIKCLRKKVGTAVLCMGAGKTLIMMAISSYLDKPTLIVVPTQALVLQTYNRFIDSGAFNPADVGLLYSKEKRLAKFTIGTFQTVKSLIDSAPEQMNKYKVILFDESETTQQCETGRYIDKFYEDREYILGFTGTLYRYGDINKSIEDFIMLGITGKPIVNIPLMFLVRKGYLAYPFVHFEPVKSVFTTAGKWQYVFKKYIEENDERNRKIVDWIKEFYKRKLKVIVLVNTKKHARLIANLLPDETMKEKTIIVFGNREGMVYSGGKFIEARNIDYARLLDRIEYTDDYRVVIATQVFNRGMDIPSLNALILAFGGRSMVSIFQRIGRVLRITPTKKRTFVVDFFDKTHVFLFEQSKNRLRLYERDGMRIIVDRNRFLKLMDEEVKNVAV